MKVKRNNCIDVIVADPIEPCLTTFALEIAKRSAGIIYLGPLNYSMLFYDDLFQHAHNINYGFFQWEVTPFESGYASYGPRHVIFHRSLSLITKGKKGATIYKSNWGLYSKKGHILTV